MIKQLDDILESWIGTPYADGQACKGRAADCVRSVDCIYQEHRGIVLPPLLALPADISFHSSLGFTVMMQAMRDRHPVRLSRDSEIPVGCAILVSTGRSHVSHIGIVGTRGFYHTTRMTGFHRSSIEALLTVSKVQHIYVPCWIHPLTSPNGECGSECVCHDYGQHSASVGALGVQHYV